MLKKDLGLLILLIVVAGIVAFLNPRFISPINLSNTANLVGLFGLISVGQGFVIITSGIDLSVGSILALLGVIFIDLLTTYQMNWALAVLVIVLAGTVLGWIHGFLITKLKMQPFIVTLCGLLLYRGIARWYTQDSTQGFGYATDYDRLEWLMSGRTFDIPHTFIFLLIVAAILAVVLHKSMFGRYLFAVGKNEEAARFSGIPTSRVIVAAYVLAGVLTGLSSVFFVFYTQSVAPSAHGNFYELYAIAAAVLGGCSLRGGEGSILGIVLGMVLLQVLQNLVNILGIPSSLNFAVMGAVILLGVIADRELQRRRQNKIALASAEARSLARRPASAPV